MKLEFESNAVSSPLVGSQVPAEFEKDQASPEVLETLKEGIAAAQSGDRAQARTLLMKVTEAEPKNENAWLWLASISEYPEELLVFLNNVLSINPQNERAKEWSAATKSLIAKTFVQRGIDAAKDEQSKFAKQCFLQAIVHDSESELAWLWLASVSESTDEKISHLQKVLQINPDNENARVSLKSAKEKGAKVLLPKANSAAIAGDRVAASKLLEQIFSASPDFEDAWMLKAHISESFADKIAAFERVLEINPENQVARANVESLKMFEQNQETKDDGPKVGFDGASYADEEVVQEVSEPTAETEQFTMEPIEEVEFQQEDDESIESIEVASEFEPAEEVNAFEDVAHAVADEPESLDLSDSADQVVFDEEESEEEVQFNDVEPALDHDYQEEAVDVADNVVEFESSAAEAEVEASFEEVVEEQQAEEVVAEEPEAAASEVVEYEFESDQQEEEVAQFEPVEEEVQMESAQEEARFEQDVEAELEAAQEYAPVQDEPAEDAFDVASEEVAEEVSDDAAVETQEDESAEMEASNEDHPTMPSFEEQSEFVPELPSVQASKESCPFCEEDNDPQAFACSNCRAIFTVSDLDMILNHTKADQEAISDAVTRMEESMSVRGVVAEELKFMGIGYLNLKDFKKGLDYLREAVQRDPSDTMLASQVNALADKVADIEEQNRIHESEDAVASKKILVVDDSPTVRKLISGKLEKSGHEPIAAVDGMDALAKINEVIPDFDPARHHDAENGWLSSL